MTLAPHASAGVGGFGFSAGMFGIGALIMIAFWVLVIGGAVWLVVTLDAAELRLAHSPPLGKHRSTS